MTATGRAAKAGKIRSTPITLLLVTIAAVIGYYACWVFWLYASVQRFVNDADLKLMDIAKSPSELWEGVKIFNHAGTWSFGTHSSTGGNVSGIFLTLIWIVEAGTIFVAAYATAVWSFKNEMFCERCSRWCGPARRIRQTAPGDADLVRRQLESHNFASLDTLGPSDQKQFWDIEHGHCSSCNNLHTLSITQTSIATDKKGNNKSTKKIIVNKLLLDPAQAATLTAAKPAPQPPPINKAPTEPDSEA